MTDQQRPTLHDALAAKYTEPQPYKGNYYKPTTGVAALADAAESNPHLLETLTDVQRHEVGRYLSYRAQRAQTEKNQKNDKSGATK